VSNGEKNVNYADTYDIFLSYRRDGGEAMAILLRDRLTEKGFKVFLDIENLNSGSFNTKLFDVIDNCKDFILICSKGGLDRCVHEGDWVRLEIAHALEKGKNIVPVMLRGFEFPDVLPADIEPLRMQNGVNANSHEYFDAAIERLSDKFLTSKPQFMSEIPEMSERLRELVSQSVKPNPKKRIAKAFTAVFAVLLAAVIAAFTFLSSKQEQTEIIIYNNTPDTIHSIQLKRSDRAEWGDNIVTEFPLISGETVSVMIPIKDMAVGVTYDMESIFYFGDTTSTFSLSGFSMYELSGIVVFVDEDSGGYEREFLRGE